MHFLQLPISWISNNSVFLQAYNKDFLGNGHLEGRRPYGVRLQPLPARGNDGMNRWWKVSSLLKKNNKTAPIMEENEEALSSESEQTSVTPNSWVSPEDSMEAFKNTLTSVPATKSPLNLFMSPMNGKTWNPIALLCQATLYIYTYDIMGIHTRRYTPTHTYSCSRTQPTYI